MDRVGGVCFKKKSGTSRPCGIDKGKIYPSKEDTGRGNKFVEAEGGGKECWCHIGEVVDQQGSGNLEVKVNVYWAGYVQEGKKVRRKACSWKAEEGAREGT